MSIKVRLKVLEGPAKEQQVEVEDYCVVGRSPQSHLVLADDRVSLAHLQIRISLNTIEIKDLAGGLRINDRPLLAGRLQHGDRIRVGNTEIAVHIEQGEDSPLPGQNHGKGATGVGATGPASLPMLQAVAQETRLYHLGDPGMEAPPEDRPDFPMPIRRGKGRLSFTEVGLFPCANLDGVLYAVVDAARRLDLAFRAKGQGYDPVSLFVGPQASQMADLAPYVFPFPWGAPYLADWQAVRGESAGVLLDSPATPAEVFEHLRFVFIVQDEKEQEFFFRFYDPRALRNYLPTCTPEELINFFGPIKTWICENSSGNSYMAYSLSETGKLLTKELGSIQLETLD